VTEQLNLALPAPKDTFSHPDASESNPDPKRDEVLLKKTKPTINMNAQKKKKLASKNHYTFTAISADVWLQVYEQLPDEGEKLRREALLQKGESFSVESSYLLLLTAGNPVALEVQRGGKTLYQHGELGQLGKVLKLFPIE